MSNHPEWQPIKTVPENTPVILANFTAACLLTGTPHVWAAEYVTEWSDLVTGEPADGTPMWCEASYAASNENGLPTHWMPLPPPPSSETPSSD
jgi:hypothetical protein